jgi:hypothetical protein
LLVPDILVGGHEEVKLAFGAGDEFSIAKLCPATLESGFDLMPWKMLL